MYSTFLPSLLVPIVGFLFPVLFVYFFLQYVNKDLNVIN